MVILPFPGSGNCSSTGDRVFSLVPVSVTDPGLGYRAWYQFQTMTEPGTGPGTSDRAWYRLRYRISLVIPVPVLVPVRNSVPVGSSCEPH